MKKLFTVFSASRVSVSFVISVNISTMLRDRYPQLPYRAVVPWPRVYGRAGNPDWPAAVDCVQTWLETSVGRHWCEWCWSGWSLAHSDLCAVSFRWEPSVSLFLLRFGVLVESD